MAGEVGEFQAPSANSGTRPASSPRRAAPGLPRLTGQIARDAPAIDQMGGGQHGMPQQHARSGVAHHQPNALAHGGAVAVHAAIGAGRLVVTEDAAVQATNRILQQFVALGAQSVARVVVIAAIQVRHRPEGGKLAGEAWMPLAVVHSPGGGPRDGLLCNICGGFGRVREHDCGETAPNASPLP